MHTRGRLARLAVACALAAAVASIAACDTSEPSADASTWTPEPTGSYDGPRDPKLEEFLYRRNCDKDLTDKERQVPEVDISTYSWTIPDGFEAVTGYSPKIAVEGAYRNELAAPTLLGRTLNVVGFTLYPQLELGPLVNECGVITIDDMLARVALYDAMDTSGGDSTTSVGEVGGLPAVISEGWDTDLGVHYTSYDLFGRNQLLSITCQWTDQSVAPLIDAGCDSLLASVQFG